MIPRLKADFGWRELFAAAAIGGRAADVAAFENAFAKTLGQDEAVAFAYGRSALLILLEALGIDDAEVICPAYTCVVVANAIVEGGNHPVFVDCCDHDYNMDFDALENAVNERTRAVIATSIFGHPLDLGRLDAFAARHPDIIIIQDCAHSFGAEWKDRAVNKAGVAAIYGLNISKIISSIYGGAITTDDRDLAARLRRLRDARLKPPRLAKRISRFLFFLLTYPAFWPPIYGLVNRLERSGLLDRITKYYDENLITMPPDYLDAMAGVEARVGRAQCAKYLEVVSHRRKLAAFYLERLHGINGLRLPPWNPGATYSHFAVFTESAPQIIADARRAGVQLGELIEYHIPDFPAYKKAPYFGERRAARWPDHMVNLPVHRGVSAQAAERIVEVIIAAAAK